MKKLAGILLAVMVIGLFCSATAVQAQSLNLDWQSIKAWAITGETKNGVKTRTWTDGFQTWIFSYTKGAISLEGISDKGQILIAIGEPSGKIVSSEPPQETEFYVHLAVSMVRNRMDGFKIVEDVNKQDWRNNQNCIEKELERGRIQQEEKRQARLSQIENEQKQAEEKIKEAIRDGRKRYVDWNFVDPQAYHKNNPDALYDSRSNMTKEEYMEYQQIRKRPYFYDHKSCPYGWGEEDCAKKKFFNSHSDLDGGEGKWRQCPIKQ